MNHIYTDGGCRPTNPGPGAWAAIVISGADVTKTEVIDTMSGFEESTTNNIMEMTAVINALYYAYNSTGNYKVITDSEYVKKGLTEWLPNWVKNGWKNAKGKPVANKELWMTMNAIYVNVKDKVTITWTKAHANSKGNILADELCTKLLKS